MADNNSSQKKQQQQQKKQQQKKTKTKETKSWHEHLLCKNMKKVRFRHEKLLLLPPP